MTDKTYPTTGGDTSRLLEAAREYAKRGWQVLPLHTPLLDGTCSGDKPDCDDVGKHPRTPRGFYDATTDEETIRQWWRKWPDANVGIRTGRESGLLSQVGSAPQGMPKDQGGFPTGKKRPRRSW